MTRTNMGAIERKMNGEERERKMERKRRKRRSKQVC
jgi:hypothetical protein